MATPCSKNVCALGGDYWADSYPEKTPTQAYCPPDACSAVKPSSSTKLTLFDQSARKIGPPQRLANNAKTPGSVQRPHQQHSAAKRIAEPGGTATKPRSHVKQIGARLNEEQENDLCRAFGAAVRVPSDPVQPQAHVAAKGTSEKPRYLPADDQKPSTPSMYDSIRRYEFVKRALEEATNREAGILNQQQIHTRLQGTEHPGISKGGPQVAKDVMPQPDKQQQRQRDQEQLGRTDMYAAVRPNKATREEIGGDKALTPVRRSARKPHKSEVQTEEDADAHNGRSVADLLESTKFCYTPNKELTPLIFGQDVECSKAHGTEGKQLRF
ncbi:hypothetical protein DUNSADRAFT_16072 [Dunaliella salina]|uniref:Encoded protein n=1 Tax=Dunaliella salina TaxID=3046 RepID=A0ABQ7G4B3_DUNSA|nr:hypothetical protein DUNSADRAFT_16072 [Dunaliella salina]|eukprot:KAF5829448.1 hypothetical protein DUNSADRAFT_16072 [Dunaliella salina]